MSLNPGRNVDQPSRQLQSFVWMPSIGLGYRQIVVGMHCNITAPELSLLEYFRVAKENAARQSVVSGFQARAAYHNARDLRDLVNVRGLPIGRLSVERPMSGGAL